MLHAQEISEELDDYLQEELLHPRQNQGLDQEEGYYLRKEQILRHQNHEKLSIITVWNMHWLVSTRLWHKQHRQRIHSKKSINCNYLHGDHHQKRKVCLLNKLYNNKSLQICISDRLDESEKTFKYGSQTPNGSAFILLDNILCIDMIVLNQVGVCHGVDAVAQNQK